MTSSPARWVKANACAGTARALAQQLGCSPLLARILSARGFRDPSAAASFLNPRLDHLHDPFLLTDMRPAVGRIRRAIAGREPILLYGDYDVDGTTSIVLLKTALDLAGAVADYHIPNRLRDGYGMRTEVVEEAAARGIRLLITADTGIRNADEVARANALGIDVVVTDHHLPGADLPPACAVLNPNRPGCPYPEKNLCGAGVVFKLVQALLREMDWPASRVQALTESFLKVVAIATVADVVPLTGENRVIVRHGLAGLGATRNSGLRCLLSVAGFREGETPSAGQVAFRVAPRINAAGRMAAASDVVEMMLTKDASRAAALAARLDTLNAERQGAEADMLAACLRQPLPEGACALVFSGRQWHKGVAGIVASRLVERYYRPVFVLCEDGSTGTATGSGRSIPRFHLLNALESMSGLFDRFGGHEHAAGVTLATEAVEEFRARFQQHAAEQLSADDLRPSVRIDADVRLAELTDATAAEVLSLAPFGHGNPAPVLMANRVELASAPELMKERHLRLRVHQGGRALTLKGWNFASRAGEIRPGSRYGVAFTIEDDAFSAARGFAPWSATLRDLRAESESYTD